MIEAFNLHKIFGSFHAVRDISLNVAAGEVVALLGPNGAGKTTTVRMLGAILKPTRGRARIAGYDVVEQARAVRHLVGLLTEFPGLYNRMQPVEYLRFFGALQGMDAVTCERRCEALLKQFGLWEARGKRLDSFSKGMKQKVTLIRALIHDPPVLFLDEPTTAMDPHSARTVRDAIDELRAARRTILLTTHNLAEAETLADRIVIVRGGQIVAQGTIAQLTRQLLGEPVWELRLAVRAHGVALLLDDLVHVEAAGDDWVQYRCPDPRSINPQVIARLAARNTPVVALAELPRRLEDVYLSIVADEQAERGIWSAEPGEQELGTGGQNQELRRVFERSEGTDNRSLSVANGQLQPTTNPGLPLDELANRRDEGNGQPALDTTQHVTLPLSEAKGRSPTHPITHSAAHPLTDDEEVRR